MRVPELVTCLVVIIVELVRRLPRTEAASGNAKDGLGARKRIGGKAKGERCQAAEQ